MLQLVNQPIAPDSYLEKLRHPSNGAFVSFEGWVRDNENGKPVSALEYEAFEPLCFSEAQKILNEIRDRFGVIDAVCLHRLGRVLVGQMSVWIGVSAPHRDEAFKACRYIIDEIKERLPIWKKEIYLGGSSLWVNSRQQPSECFASQEYYSRQIALPQIGLPGQEELKNSRVLVVGLGGLGSAAVISLAQAGVGTIGIVESDTLEVSNLHRQSLYSVSDIGKMKIDLAALRLNAINPFVRIVKFSERFDAVNFEKVIADFDIILDCTDNFSTKFLLNDVAVLFEKVLIQASIYQFEGQIRVYAPQAGCACLRCLWPQVPADDCIGNCVQAGTLGAVVNVMGHLQAWEAIKWILRLESRLGRDFLIVDFKTFSISKIKNPPCSFCPLCGKNPSMKEILKENYMPIKKCTDLSVDLDTLSRAQIKNFVFVDVRESDEISLYPVKAVKSLHLPFSRFGAWDFDFQRDKKYLIYCAHGMRSLACVEKLRNRGVANVQSVNNGAYAVNQYFVRDAKVGS